MSLPHVLLACTIIAIAVHFAALRIRHRLAAQPERLSPMIHGFLALLLFLRTAAILGAIGYGLLLIGFTVWRLIGFPLFREDLVAVIVGIQNWRQNFSFLSDWWAYVIAITVGFGLSIWIFRRGEIIARELRNAWDKNDHSVGTLGPAVVIVAKDGSIDLGRLVLSRGWLDTLAVGDKWLALASLMLALLSIIGAEADGILQKRIEQLKLTLAQSQSEALASWKNLKGGDVSHSVENNESKQLEMASSDLAQIFQDTWMGHLQGPVGTMSDRTRYGFDVWRVRSHILKVYANTSGVARHVVLEPGKPFGRNADPSFRKAAERFQEKQADNPGSNPFTERVEKDIQRELREASPTIRSRIIEAVAEWQKSFHEPLKPADLLNEAFSIFVDQQIELVQGQENTPNSLESIHFSNKGVGETVGAAVNHLYETGLVIFLKGLAEGEGTIAAAARIIKEELNRPVILTESRQEVEETIRVKASKMPTEKELENMLELSRPTLRQSDWELQSEKAKRQTLDAAQSPARLSLVNHPIVKGVRARSQMTTYESLFPGNITPSDSENIPGHVRASEDLIKRSFDFQRVSRISKVGASKPITSRKLPGIIHEPIKVPDIQRVLPKKFSGNGVITDKSIDWRSLVTEFHRQNDAKTQNEERRLATLGETIKSFNASFNYDINSLYSKVGGVVIGRHHKSNQNKTLDFRKISWKYEGKRIRFTLTRYDGALIEIPCSFDENTVQQSLAYVADGRPVAVTMIRTGQSHKLKVLLHPVLLDTALGRDIAEIDRLVDRFFLSEERDHAVTSLRIAISAYDYARLIALRSLTAQYQSIGKINLTPSLKVIDDSLSSPELQSNAKLALSNKRLYNDLSVLTDRAKAFESSIREVLTKCGDQDARAFPSCVDLYITESVYSVDLVQQKSNLRSKIMELMRPTHAVEVVSGVREAPYTIDPDLNFLRPPSSPDAEIRLWPFQFVLQATFTSVEPPLVTRAEDEIPAWHLPRITSNMIASQIEQGIASDIHLQAALRRVRDFVVLDRLFRVALAGDFGPHFPVYRLAQLSNETAVTEVPLVATQLWSK
jgi:hypothetical protein